MRQFWWPRHRALGAVLAVAAVLVGATARAQTAMTCDAASFEKLGLPKTRIVSASAVKDDARAGPHCVLRGAVNELMTLADNHLAKNGLGPVVYTTLTDLSTVFPLQ